MVDLSDGVSSAHSERKGAADTGSVPAALVRMGKNYIPSGVVMMERVGWFPPWF